MEAPANFAAGHHVMQLYESKDSLALSVAAFFARGLARGDPVLMISSPRKFDLVRRHLGLLNDAKKIQFVDAEATVTQSLNSDRLNPRGLQQAFDELLAAIRRDRQQATIWVYGDIVDLLRKRQQHQGAVELQEIASALCSRYQPMAILCGHAVRARAPAYATETLDYTSTIYLIDDEESVRRSLARLLAQLKLPVRTYASAEEFLAQVDATARGCLIVDVHLPGMKGPELQSLLNAGRWSLPVIAISGSLDRQIESEALRRGAKAFLCKPFDGKTLVRAVKSAIDETEKKMTIRPTGSV